MSKSPGTSSKSVSTKRQVMREKRRQQQQKQRLTVLLIIIGVALVIAAILIVPSLLPAGDINTADPITRPMEDGRALGDPNAPVTIEVFEDFQCPACQVYSQQIEPQVIEAYIESGEVYYIFRQFPILDDDKLRLESDQAANASMCAADQDRFWDYHDIVFANQSGENRGTYTDNRLVAFAEEVGLDMAEFNDCFEENRFQAEIEADLERGRSLNATGTPSVYVNEQILTPGFVPSFEDISQAVEAALAGQGN